MAQDLSTSVFPQADEIAERLNEQHDLTTKALGFLVHPSITSSLPTTSVTPLKVADIATGTGIFLLSLASSEVLPSNTQYTGYDVSSSAFPPASTWPTNIIFTIHDMLLPFPPSEIGTYDVVCVRFVTIATTKSEWQTAIKNLMTLLKPGGWLQWIESCNFALYNSIPGTSRKTCLEIFHGLAPFRVKGEEVVIGMMMRETADYLGSGREELWRECGLGEVHEDIFSSDRLGDKEDIRLRGTKNALECFLGCLEDLVGKDGSGWDSQRLERVQREAMSEVDRGVYCTFDQVCIIGRKASA